MKSKRKMRTTNCQGRKKKNKKKHLENKRKVKEIGTDPNLVICTLFPVFIVFLTHSNSQYPRVGLT